MEALKKERSLLESTAEKLQTLALQAGAEKVEVCASFHDRNRISLEKQDYHLVSSDYGYDFGVRVLRDGRQGFAACNCTDPYELKEIASRAVEIARFSPANPLWQISNSKNISSGAPTEGFWDEKLFQMSLTTQKEWVKLLLEEATKDARFRLNEGSVTLANGLFLVHNSAGTHHWQKETNVSWGLMGMGVDGDKITSFDYFGEMSRKAEGAREKLIRSTREFCQDVVSQLQSGSGESYRGLAVFSPRAVRDILLRGIVYHMNGRNVWEKTAKWTPDQLEQRVLSEQITISDTPWNVERSGATLFDREGTPTQDQVLVENGKLKRFLLDNYAATALKMQSSGHAAGGPNAVPAVSAHNLKVSPGKESWKSLQGRLSSERQNYLVIQRFSGQVNPVTGDFSGVAKGGEWWRGGEKQFTVKETLISGNVFQALSVGLFGVSSDTQVLDSAEETPYLISDNVSVTCS